MNEGPLEGDLVAKARRARYWGRPVTDEEADVLLARVTRLEDVLKLALEAVNFGHTIRPDSRLYRELIAVLDEPQP